MACKPCLTIMAVSLVAANNPQRDVDPRWRVLGDTSAAPPRCSAAASIHALGLFFASMRSADTKGLDEALAPRFVFTIIPLTTGEKFTSSRSLQELARYARIRRTAHTRMTIEAVTFNGWRGDRLNFGPIYWLRSDGEAGKPAIRGGGKGTYECRKGISILNLGPLSPNDPGPQLRD